MTDLPAKWKVERHGGRCTDVWRVAYEGDEHGAHRKFSAMYLNMRQGGLRLVDTNGVVRREYDATLLRTRW